MNGTSSTLHSPSSDASFITSAMLVYGMTSYLLRDCGRPFHVGIEMEPQWPLNVIRPRKRPRRLLLRLTRSASIWQQQPVDAERPERARVARHGRAWCDKPMRVLRQGARAR